jgi:xanthine dehydrogenase accessory factor
MVTAESGEAVGALSGGCVDADVLLACDRVHAGGVAEVLAFGSDDDAGQSELACGGTISIWIHELQPAAVSAILGGCDAAVLTRRIGLNIVQDAVPCYAAMDYACGKASTEPERAIAANWLLDSHSRAEFVELSNGDELFLEAFSRHRLFVVVGSSGYTAALCAQAALIGYDTVVVEPRPRFAAGITYADEVIGSWPAAALEQLTKDGRLDDRSTIVVCTHDPKFDEPALAAALRTPAIFIGALGSRITCAERFARLRAHGIPEHDLDRIHSPVGLDLGGASPAETAVSVFAEIISVATGRSALPLRNTSGPLHA